MDHTVVIRSHSARSEGRRVAALALAIAVLALGSIWVRRGNAREGVAALYGWQRPFRDLSAADQRIVIALREGLLEAENVRSANLVWSSVESLAEKGVPPFAPDPIDGDAYRWSFRREKNVINYVGTPKAGSNRSAFLLMIVEPTEEELNGTAPSYEAPAENDEVYHVLSDGTAIYVSTWMKNDVHEVDRIIVAPEREGWIQVIVKAGP